MRALLLNSGVGKRMGALTSEHPKCMTELVTGETILSRQLSQLEKHGIKEIIITTGPFADALKQHAQQSVQNAKLIFVNNPEYDSTNYIYSIFLARRHLHDDIISLHGDLVLADEVLAGMLDSEGSQMVVSTTQPLPEKDFKAVLRDGLVRKVGIQFFDSAVAAQPLYKLTKADWQLWLDEIESYIHNGERGCYAENALNALEGACKLQPYDVADTLCTEIDNPEDLKRVNGLLGG